jgi:Ca-activated chloride channel family protein
MWGPDITFANPEYLWALALLPLLAAWYVWRRGRRAPALQYSTLLPFARSRPTVRERLVHFPFLLRLLALGLLLIAIARPRTTSQGEDVYTEGIDIVMVLDISGSMLAEDFRPNRIEAAKKVAEEFVGGRPNDRIGLVVFSGESFTQCPMTLDHRVLTSLLQQVRTGIIEDGTAIGLGMAQGVNRLKDSKSKSKVMILLTDGVNNRGEIDPITAAQIARSFDVRVYTVGVGTIGEAPYPAQTPFGIVRQMVPVEVDEKTLQTIASMTEGQYFRATNNRALREIYQEIDRLEKTRIEVRAYRSYTELFYPWAFAALGILLLELVLGATVLRRIP